MATGCVDHTMSIWDIRNLDGPLQKYRLHSPVTDLAFSQKSFVGVALGNVVEVNPSVILKTYYRHLFLRLKYIGSCLFRIFLGV